MTTPLSEEDLSVIMSVWRTTEGKNEFVRNLMLRMPETGMKMSARECAIVYLTLDKAKTLWYTTIVRT